MPRQETEYLYVYVICIKRIYTMNLGISVGNRSSVTQTWVGFEHFTTFYCYLIKQWIIQVNATKFTWFNALPMSMREKSDTPFFWDFYEKINLNFN